MMSRKAQAVLLLGLLLMTTPYFLPLWKITLVAPQYPESLGMYIWVDRVEGASPTDLQNINILNHYIGMKEIRPDAIPELKIMKPILTGILLTGLIVLVLRRRNLLIGWFVISSLLGVLGLVDFYLWEYDYGHNLDPNAPIKIPGMSYQPPFIGTKQLLNIYASSYPYWGGILFGLGMFLAFIAIWLSFRGEGYEEIEGVPPQEEASRANTGGGAALSAMVLLLILTLSGCSPQPEPIQFGKDLCHFCSMVITDQRYGAELVTQKGRVYKFDSIECMFAFPNKKKVTIHSQWTVDFGQPRTLIPIEKALYLHTPKLPSPMGMNVASFSRKEDLEKVRKKYGGEEIPLKKVVEMAKIWLKNYRDLKDMLK